MKRIIVVGVTGSGKSTLARSLAEKKQIPYIQLDALFWKPNWQTPSDEEFFEKIKNAITQPAWIVDGNYNRSNHLTWTEADTIIWIDLPFWLTLYQNVTRSIVRASTKKELWPQTGNIETFKMMFSKESIVWWLIKSYSSQRQRYLNRINDPKCAHLTFIHLKSRREIQVFLNQF